MKKKFFLGLLVSIVLLAFVACNMEMSQEKFDEAYTPKFTQVGDQVYITCSAENAAVYYTVDGDFSAVVTVGTTTYTDTTYIPEEIYKTYRVGQGISLNSFSWQNQNNVVKVSNINLIKAKVVVNGRETTPVTYSVKAIVGGVSTIKATILGYDDDKLSLELANSDFAKIYCYDTAAVTTTGWETEANDSIVDPSQFKLYTEPFKAYGVVYYYAETYTGSMTKIFKVDFSNITNATYKTAAVQYDGYTIEQATTANKLVVTVTGATGTDFVLSVTCNGETAPSGNYEVSGGKITLKKAGKYVITLKDKVQNQDPSVTETVKKTIEVEMKKTATPALTAPVFDVEAIIALNTSETDVDVLTDEYIKSLFVTGENTTLTVSNAVWTATDSVFGEETSDAQTGSWKDKFDVPTFSIDELGYITLTNASAYSSADLVSFYTADFVAAVKKDGVTTPAHFENVTAISTTAPVEDACYVIAVAQKDGYLPKFSAITHVSERCATPVITVTATDGGLMVTVSTSTDVNTYVRIDGAAATTLSDYVLYFTSVSDLGEHTITAYARANGKLGSYEATATFTLKQVELEEVKVTKSGSDYYFKAYYNVDAEDFYTTGSDVALSKYTHDFDKVSATETVHYYGCEEGYVDSVVYCTEIDVAAFVAEKTAAITATYENSTVRGKKITFSAPNATFYVNGTALTDGVYDGVDELVYASGNWNSGKTSSVTVSALFSDSIYQFEVTKTFTDVPYMEELNAPTVAAVSDGSDYGKAVFTVTAPTTTTNYGTPINGTVKLEYRLTATDAWTEVVNHTIEFETKVDEFYVRAYAPGYNASTERDVLTNMFTSTAIPQIKIEQCAGYKAVKLYVSSTDAKIYYRLMGDQATDNVLSVWKDYSTTSDIIINSSAKTYLEVKYLEKGKLSSGETYYVATATDNNVRTFTDLTTDTDVAKNYPFITTVGTYTLSSSDYHFEKKSGNNNIFTFYTSLDPEIYIFKYQTSEVAEEIIITSGTDITPTDLSYGVKINLYEAGKLFKSGNSIVEKLKVYKVELTKENVAGGVLVTPTYYVNDVETSSEYIGGYYYVSASYRTSGVGTYGSTVLVTTTDFAKLNEDEGSVLFNKLVSNTDFALTFEYHDEDYKAVYKTSITDIRVLGKLVCPEVTTVTDGLKITETHTYFRFEDGEESLPSTAIGSKVSYTWFWTSTTDMDTLTGTSCSDWSDSFQNTSTTDKHTPDGEKSWYLWTKVEAAGYETTYKCYTASDLYVAKIKPAPAAVIKVEADYDGYKLYAETGANNVYFKLNGVEKPFKKTSGSDYMLITWSDVVVGNNTLEGVKTTKADCVDNETVTAVTFATSGSDMVLNTNTDASYATFFVEPQIEQVKISSVEVTTTSTDTDTYTVKMEKTTSDTNVTYFYRTQINGQFNPWTEWKQVSWVSSDSFKFSQDLTENEMTGIVQVIGKAMGAISADCSEQGYDVRHK